MGTKRTIASVVNIVVAYLASKNYIDGDLATLILGLCAVFTGIAVGDGIRKGLKK